MIIFPAIDLYEKKAVRLYQGSYENRTVYSDSPISVARDFVSQGASCVHLVDLEGARDGTTPNLEVVTAIKKETGLFAEIGGGIRSLDTVKRYLDAGLDRVILGTAAVKDPAFMEAAAAAFGSRIAVGADVKDGCIAIRGWLETAAVTLEDFLQRMQELGIRNVICTDISRDGAMRGTNLELYRHLSQKFSLDLTASGGVSTMEDILQLRKMELYGAIIGKAYYTGAIALEEAIEAAR